MKRALCLTAFFFLSIFRTTASNALDVALSNRNISPLLDHWNDTVIVVTLDGSISLADSASQRILWTYKSGVPIYSSYQAPHHVDTYIDVGLDWQLYMHDKTKGITKRLSASVKDLVSATPFSVNGTTIIGQMTTTVTILDAKTGTLIQTFSPSSLGFDWENAIVLGGTAKKLVEPRNSRQESAELVYITRTDYAFMAYSESRSVLWNFMYSDITAELSSGSGISCSRNFFSSQDTPGLEFKADFNMPTSCQRNIMVHRIRDRGHSDQFSLVVFVGHLPYSLPGHMGLVPAENTGMQLSILGHGNPMVHHGHPVVHHGGIKEEMLSFSSSENVSSATTALALPTGSVSINGDTYVGQLAWPSFILLGIFLLLMVGFAIYYYFVAFTSIEQDKDLKLKPSVTKKKKTRKSGNSKNSNQMEKLKGNESGGGNGESSSILAYARMSLSGLMNGHAEGRLIGKLYISSNEIAKGSNGTVVFEGVYDGRLVAVKRLVQTHHEVALKEIQNLIASDQHPNIVRWYGMEFDSDFVYISLELCTCNLNDLISLYSQPTKNATASEDKDSYLMNEYFVQLQQRIGRTTDFELWRANGYPSAQLLKLMRDVVSGLAHLHEIGIIHRDLKPQNVLIIKEKTFCAKLSDMGISKRLDGDMTSLSQHATGIGSSGWRAPEQLKNGRQTRAMDLFSLGCVLFFCITGGRHPFGDTYERDANIVNNQKDLFLVDDIPEALDLIARLLDPNPDLRPKAVEVLYHPLFWNSDTRLSFLRDVSDRVELEDRESESELLKALESVGSEALGGKWDEKLDNSFLDNIGRYRRYKYDSVRDLLRVVRNKLNHYRELPKDIQEALGSIPEGFDYYFTSRFPRLLIEVYKVIRMYCEGEELLSKYFKSSLI